MNFGLHVKYNFTYEYTNFQVKNPTKSMVLGEKIFPWYRDSYEDEKNSENDEKKSVHLSAKSQVGGKLPRKIWIETGMTRLS